MKPTKQYILIAFICLAAGFALSRIVDDQQSVAANFAEGANGRYALSAYTTGTGDYGCYILDTSNGEIWHQRPSGRAQKIGGLQ